MYTEESYTQVTFYYENGQVESFVIPMNPAEFQQQIAGLFKRPWLVFHLFDETVFIATSKIVKLEVKPPLLGIRGEGIYNDAQRVTALVRGR
jgi:hypothetical protein